MNRSGQFFVATTKEIREHPLEVPGALRRLEKQSIMFRSIIQICILLSILTTCVTAEGPALCDPLKSRHCFTFPEKDVDSSYNGIGQVDTRKC